jgi:hypothetical protein
MGLAWIILDAAIGEISKDIGKASRIISFYGIEGSRTDDQTISL